MSDMAEDKPVGQKRGFFQGAWLYVLAGLPAGHLWGAFENEQNLSTRGVWVLTGSWLVVWAVTILIVVALNRIWTNLRFHHRPFTVKDQKYCARAGNGALLGAALLLTYTVIVALVTERPDDNLVHVADMVSTQAMYLLTSGAILHVLAEVHRRGAHYFEELEKGV